MHLRYLTPGGAEAGDADDLASWRAASTGSCGSISMRATTRRRGCSATSSGSIRKRSRRAVIAATCRRSTAIPTTGSCVVHRPFIGRAGHVHLLQLEQFIRSDAVVTLHGPAQPRCAIRPKSPATPTRCGLRRRRPPAPQDAVRVVAHIDLGASLAASTATTLGTIASKVAELENDVMNDDLRRPEELLERMFLLRHELVTVRTMAGRHARGLRAHGERRRRSGVRRPRS